MTALVNKLLWSTSRARYLHDCQRLYWFKGYGSWGGWERGAPEETREAYRLGKLSSRWSWAGDAVHGQIRREIDRLHTGVELNLADALAEMRVQMRAQWVHSKKSTRSRKFDDGGFWGLLEHEYGEDVPESEWKRTWARAESALTWWFESDFRRIIQETPPSKWLATDPERGEKLVSFEVLPGVPLFGAPDFALEDPDGVVHILDWKTGARKPADIDQVLGYAALLQHKHRLDPERMLGQLVYLREQDWLDVAVTQGELDDFRGRVAADVALMRSKLADPEKNIPLPVEAFAQTTVASRCARCYFRRLCKRDGEHGGPAGEDEQF